MADIVLRHRGNYREREVEPEEELLPETSEYGRGYATCLRQFLNHEERLGEWVHLTSSMSETMAVETWMNGASDHFYELVHPNISDLEWERAHKLAMRCLHIGHGFMPDSVSTEEEARRLLQEASDLLMQLEMPTTTLEEAMAVDRLLGIVPLVGDSNCPLNFPSHTTLYVGTHPVTGDLVVESPRADGL